MLSIIGALVFLAKSKLSKCDENLLWELLLLIYVTWCNEIRGGSYKVDEGDYFRTYVRYWGSDFLGDTLLDFLFADVFAFSTFDSCWEKNGFSLRLRSYYEVSILT